MTSDPNPFRPGFGQQPSVFVGRQDIVRRVDRALVSPENGDPYLKVVTRSHRGTGKTVLLDELSDSALSKGWVVIATEAGSTDTTLVQRIVTEIQRAIETNQPNPRRRLSTINVNLPVVGGGFGVELNRTANPPGSLLEAARSFFVYAETLPITPSGLFISIDEVHDAQTDDLKTVGNTLQLLERQGHPIALAMAGLPDPNPDASEPTFLARCQHLRLEALTHQEVEAGLRETAAIVGRTWADSALQAATEACAGYPYMLQLVGYHAFEQSTTNQISELNVQAGLTDALQQLSDSVLAGLRRQLSPVEQRFLFAMAMDQPGQQTRIADVATRMNEAAPYISVYRDRLIKAGLIVSTQRGWITFAIPGHQLQLRNTDGYLNFIEHLAT
jgi:AAA ATPase domain